MNDSVIKKEQYFFFLDAGIPYEGWVDFGDGMIAYALKEVEIVSVPINKYKDHFLKTQNAFICVVDNTRVDINPTPSNSNNTPPITDSDNWWANAKTAVRMFHEWDQGVGPADRSFENDRVANAFKNAWKVKEAREAFYKKHAGRIINLGDSLTNYKGNFGLKGLFKAGIDPIEQFVGSYRIDIYVIEGDSLKFTLTNKTSMESFLYGIGPAWERSSFRLNGNTTQTYIFTEPVR